MNQFSRTTRILATLLACGVGAAALLPASGEEGPPADSAAGQEQIRRLRGTWRMDPLDEMTAHRLARLRVQLDAEERDALKHLVIGLREFLDGRAHLAAASLARAHGSRRVETLTNALLPVSLTELQEQAQAAATAAGIDHRCPQCGDSAFKDCPHPICWRSFGHLPCGTCQGSGRKPGAAPDSEQGRCSTCRGFGLAHCPTCHGEGLVRCDVCHFALRDELSVEAVTAMRRVIAIATHRVLGGPQLYSAEDLRPSPKFSEPGLEPQEDALEARSEG